MYRTECVQKWDVHSWSVQELTAGDKNEGIENELMVVLVADYMHCTLKLGK